jgi:hypothetical protein
MNGGVGSVGIGRRGDDPRLGAEALMRERLDLPEAAVGGEGSAARQHGGDRGERQQRAYAHCFDSGRGAGLPVAVSAAVPRSVPA